LQINKRIEVKRMNIKIGEYQITSDSMQFIVSKITTIQESRFTKAENVGKETTKIIAYCSKIDEAIRFIPNDVLKTNEDISIIIDKLNEIQEVIEGLERKPVIYIKSEPKVKIVSEEEMEMLENE
jgi:hypothetical protein